MESRGVHLEGDRARQVDEIEDRCRVEREW